MSIMKNLIIPKTGIKEVTLVALAAEVQPLYLEYKELGFEQMDWSSAITAACLCYALIARLVLKHKSSKKECSAYILESGDPVVNLPQSAENGEQITVTNTAGKTLVTGPGINKMQVNNAVTFVFLKTKREKGRWVPING